MIELLTSRRSFLTGLGAVLVAAPAIVRAGSLMPVRAFIPVRVLPPESDLMAELLIKVTRQAFLPRMYAQFYAASDINRMIQIGAAGA